MNTITGLYELEVPSSNTNDALIRSIPRDVWKNVFSYLLELKEQSPEHRTSNFTRVLQTSKLMSNALTDVASVLSSDKIAVNAYEKRIRVALGESFQSMIKRPYKGSPSKQTVDNGPNNVLQLSWISEDELNLQQLFSHIAWLIEPDITPGRPLSGSHFSSLTNMANKVAEKLKADPDNTIVDTLVNQISRSPLSSIENIITSSKCVMLKHLAITDDRISQLLMNKLNAILANNRVQHPTDTQSCKMLMGAYSELVKETQISKNILTQCFSLFDNYKPTVGISPSILELDALAQAFVKSNNDNQSIKTLLTYLSKDQPTVLKHAALSGLSVVQPTNLAVKETALELLGQLREEHNDKDAPYLKNALNAVLVKFIDHDKYLQQYFESLFSRSLSQLITDDTQINGSKDHAQGLKDQYSKVLNDFNHACNALAQSSPPTATKTLIEALKNKEVIEQLAKTELLKLIDALIQRATLELSKEDLFQIKETLLLLSEYIEDKDEQPNCPDQDMLQEFPGVRIIDLRGAFEREQQALSRIMTQMTPQIRAELESQMEGISEELEPQSTPTATIMNLSRLTPEQKERLYPYIEHDFPKDLKQTPSDILDSPVALKLKLKPISQSTIKFRRVAERAIAGLKTIDPLLTDDDYRNALLEHSMNGSKPALGLLNASIASRREEFLLKLLTRD